NPGNEGAARETDPRGPLVCPATSGGRSIGLPAGAAVATRPVLERSEGTDRSVVRAYCDTPLRGGALGGRPDDPPEVLRREELGDGHRPGDGAEETVGLLLVLAQGGEELLHLGRGRLQGGQLVGELVDRQRRL